MSTLRQLSRSIRTSGGWRGEVVHREHADIAQGLADAPLVIGLRAEPAGQPRLAEPGQRGGRIEPGPGEVEGLPVHVGGKHPQLEAAPRSSSTSPSSMAIE